ncbi:MAG: SRPBCC domain-containing protein [Bacteroidetes bacterium]|nr:SRPBCC domain-containing protein [Bacteroidota bacterium]
MKVLAGNSAEKAHNEPAGKFELEYVVHSSASILFEFLTSPSGLSEWFCDDVNIRNENCSFVWDGVEQKAKLVKFIEEKLVRFQWEDKGDGSYFEFRIERDDLTNDISLMVTDFAETAEERESSKLLWDSQIEQLMKVLGSY